MILAVCVAVMYQSQVDVKWVDDEAQAVLSMLGKTPVENDWQTLFATEGYRRLKDREAGIHRPFTDDDFRKFVSSQKLIDAAPKLRTTLAAWGKTDVASLAKKSLAYLPKDAKIHATIYPLIKSYTNSFVWDTQTNPAIMLYLNPDETAEEYQKTVIHELHHIGYASCCPSKEFSAWEKGLKPSQQLAWDWLGAFGEGYAVLAAAGDTKTDPMLYYSQDVKDAFKHGMDHLAEDMGRIESFVLDTTSEKIKGDEVQNRAVQFYGTQGPWYSVGYRVAIEIENTFGRETLLSCYSDPRKLMPLYNEAVDIRKDGSPKWSAKVLNALGLG
ncbi:MAG TPA: DUF5700 domain-containing putative Zn-dependent protease [Fimbriimonadaceae bacterium]|nr:DUF5700 domain-containing putative Zn-dependent protease [Fimbriimonadaceae bacterium]